MPSPLKRYLLGRPLRTDEARHQRLKKVVALAVFSSDALSSVAYATEEILLALVLAGTLALHTVMPISIAIGCLLVVVAISYRQTIKAYPGGGGAYGVAKDNLGVGAGLVAGASLLVDYVLTVAVSVSAGTAAITSAFPALDRYRVGIAVALVVLLVLANLRGMKESGSLFALPTYFFVVCLGSLVVAGLFRYATGGSIEVTHAAVAATQDVTLFLILRAFASGCTAMTGVEAIANGVQAFEEPAARNARATLTWMAGILLFMFLGVSALAALSGVQPAEETVISQLARGTFGTGVFYYMLQAATALILVLAANTSYADFPRLGSIMAGDGYLPKQLKDRGDRLVYSNGMLLLTAFAIGLIIAFRATTHLLIPLYAVGVFTSFTLSQAGMVLHWWKCREPGWHWSMAVNSLGAVTTAVVLVVIVATKFVHGAWVIIVLVPVLVAYFSAIKRHYEGVERRLYMPVEKVRSHGELVNHVVLLVAAIDRRLPHAITYARSLKAASCDAIYVDVTGEGAKKMRAEWDEGRFGIPLQIIESPYRELVEPILRHVRELPHRSADEVVTVILPEFVPAKLADYLLHDPTPFFIKQALYLEPGVIVTDVPYHLKTPEAYDESREPDGVRPQPPSD